MRLISISFSGLFIEFGGTMGIHGIYGEIFPDDDLTILDE